MRLEKLILKNFRGYRSDCFVEFNNLTTLIGTNDVGKSTVLEALDIFFNDSKGCIKIDSDDLNKHAKKNGEAEIIISVTFSELPNEIIIDDTNPTSLSDEYLLNNGNLEIIKKYSNGGAPKTYIKCLHPTNDNCCDLLQKTSDQLRKTIEKNGIECCDKTKNAIMRKSIWSHYSDKLDLRLIELDFNKTNTRDIWRKLQNYIPMYSLFQADRKNDDSDNEVQDPLKYAIKEILNDPDIRAKMSDIAEEVRGKITEVSKNTLEKLREMDSDIADTLNPQIPENENLKWGDVFKNVSITGDDGIPINKRGSGVKRLILLNFFRAEAERRNKRESRTDIIYAIEEPETAQHTENQKRLIRSFVELSLAPNTQIILTTHNSNVVKELDFKQLRLLQKTGDNVTISEVVEGSLSYPSLNEINYLAFAEITEEYHNELYGYIESEKMFAEYKKNKIPMDYNRLFFNGEIKKEKKILSEYIRHQIHHPENMENAKFTSTQLRESIESMRVFIHDNSKKFKSE